MKRPRTNSLVSDSASNGSGIGSVNGIGAVSGGTVQITVNVYGDKQAL